jgi:hypothetical protein
MQKFLLKMTPAGPACRDRAVVAPREGVPA